MIFLKFIRDDGAIMNIGDGAEDYELLSKAGTSNVEVEHYYDAKGSGYGDWHSGERVKGRTLKYKITSHTGIAASRRFMEFFFNVLHKFRVESYFNGREVYLDAELLTPKHTEDLYSHEEVEITFYASDPYWKSLDDTVRNFYTQSALWHYPYAFVEPNQNLPANAYTVFERINVNKTVYVYNDGDAPALFTITIHGAVDNPEVKINDALIKYNGTVGSGESLYIDSENGVYQLDGKNVLKDMIVLGEPMLKTGDNTLVSNKEMFGTVNYHKLYNGDM